MIGKRKLILVIEVALSYDKSLAWYTNKLIRRRKKKDRTSGNFPYRGISRSNNLGSVHLGNAEEVNAVGLPCSVEGAADPSSCNSAPLVITSWSSSSERAVCHTQHNNCCLTNKYSSCRLWLASLILYVYECNTNFYARLYTLRLRSQT